MQLLMANVQVLEMVALVIMIILQQEVAALFQIAMMMSWPIIQAQIFLLSVLLLKSIWLKVMGSITIIKMAVLDGRKKTRILVAVIKTNNKNNSLNHQGWEGFVRLCLSFNIDLKAGF